MPKVLVTGANGFIGSHLVRELLNRGYEVNCLVRYTSDISSLQGLPVKLFIGDVRDPETLAAPMKDVAYVYHLAAKLMVTSREAFEQTNTQGTINMLEATEKYAKSTIKRFLFVSSQAAAGPGKDPTPLDETTEPEPISWYGSSKKQAEEAVRAFADPASLPVTIVRPASVYGEREKDISQTYPLVEARLQPKLGLKKKYMVMVYVGDLVRGIVAAAESDKALNETYFLNHPEVLTAKGVIQTIAKAMGKPWGLMFPVPIFIIRLMAPFAELIYHFTRNRPQMTRDKAREVAQRFWVADPSKAKSDLGWEAQYDLMKGTQVTIQYFREEEKKIREMPLEKGFMLWFKSILCAICLGTAIEITSALGRFYSFHPRWIVFIVVIGGFGLTLGSLAAWLRKRSDLLQCIVGTLVAGAAEVINVLQLTPNIGWEFAPNWPFGITNPWVRSLVLGFAGGFFILVVNFLMRLLYKRRLRLG